MLQDIGSHTKWMADADEIVFATDQEHGVGTAFDCHTRVGPLRTVDRMRVTEWAPREAMGVDHQGFFTGQGRFTLARARRGRTLIVWQEQLRFPWWLGGPVGALASTVVLWPIWRANLRRLATIVEAANLLRDQSPRAART